MFGRKTHWIPGPAPLISLPTTLYLNKSEMISHNHKRLTFTITGENGPYMLWELQFTGFSHVMCPVKAITWMGLGQWDNNSCEDISLVIDASFSSEAEVLSRYSFIFCDFTIQKPFVLWVQWETPPSASLCASICRQVSCWRKSSWVISDVSA